MEIHTSLDLSKAQKHEIIEDIGQFVSIIPGKGKDITMYNLKSGCHIEFTGSDPNAALNPCLFLSFIFCGTAPHEKKRQFVHDVSAMLEKKYGLPSNRVFMNLVENESWGAWGDYLNLKVIEPYGNHGVRPVQQDS